MAGKYQNGYKPDQVIFEGAVRGRTPDGKHYLFRSRHGSRYAYTCYQLKDALCGVWG